MNKKKSGGVLNENLFTFDHSPFHSILASQISIDWPAVTFILIFTGNAINAIRLAIRMNQIWMWILAIELNKKKKTEDRRKYDFFRILLEKKMFYLFKNKFGMKSGQSSFSAHHHTTPHGVTKQANWLSGWPIKSNQILKIEIPGPF